MKSKMSSAGNDSSHHTIDDDNFVNIPFVSSNLDRYIVRMSILRALKDKVNHLQGKLLDVGCGKMPYRQLIMEHGGVKEYVGLDLETATTYDPNIKPDATWDGVTMPFDTNSFDCAIATEVLEHCFDASGKLREIFRVLKPGGTFFFTTPFFWNLHEVPHDEYRFTPFSLEKHLRNSGFHDIQIHSTGGWHASLAQMLGLWVRRAPMSNPKRKYLSILLKPIIGYLLRKDIPPKQFNTNHMLTTIFGVAKKPLGLAHSEK